MREYVWKLDVEYPEGAQDDDGRFVDDWEPEGWDPSPQYVEQYRTREFYWPKIERIYRTRDAAVRRAQLLERYGATVHLLRSRPLAWEERAFPGVLSRAAKAVDA